MKKSFAIVFMILAFAVPRAGFAQSGRAPSLRAGASKGGCDARRERASEKL